MTPAYCQPINFIKVYKFAIFLAENKIAAPSALHEAKGVFSFAKENTPFASCSAEGAAILFSARKIANL